MKFTYSPSAQRAGERGSALIPTMMAVSVLAMLGLSMLSAGVTGSRAVTGAADEYRLTSAVESATTLAADRLWSAYLRSQGGAAGPIETWRAFLDTAGIADLGPGGAPTSEQGLEVSDSLALPQGTAGNELADVAITSLRIARRDDGEATRLYMTVGATSKRGQGAGKPLARALQVVYTAQPAPFEGFDFGILTKNVNCVFCHTVVDSAERYHNQDETLFSTFNKVKVGTLESLTLRNDARPGIGDWDADSSIAGTLYVRGSATTQNGDPIHDWSAQSLTSCSFDYQGRLVQDPSTGGMTSDSFVPAGTPPQAGENLYLDYPLDYAEMVDGKLPVEFPPPFPDDGGVDPTTGLPSSVGAGNRIVDPGEFHAAQTTPGSSIAGGILTVVAAGRPINSSARYQAAFHTGNRTSLGSNTSGNVVLTGTEDNPILLNGTVKIDGDVVINGWVKGTGVILASGNIYVPTDLRYADAPVQLPNDVPGQPTGSTFGVAADGTQNALGLACGGNMLLGDYLMPSPASGMSEHSFVSGTIGGGWNFALAEMALFNRTEWAHTQPLLPGQGEDPNDPSTWTVPNPTYLGEDYVPRYYQFGEHDPIPIYNLGELYFDAQTGTWFGDAEVPLEWNDSLMTLLDPNDTTNPLLYDQATGAPKASIASLSPEDRWITDQFMKHAIDSAEAARAHNTPMRIDGLLYTNNAIFGIVPRSGGMRGQMIVNGSLVCADLGLLTPGFKNPNGTGTKTNVPGSPYAVGLQLNYDKRTKTMLNVRNPYSVTLRRTLWSPTSIL